MAEDEAIDVTTCDEELAERLGVPNGKEEYMTSADRKTASPSPVPLGTAASRAIAKTRAAALAKRARAGGAASTASAGGGGGATSRVLPDLAPFLHLLPDMSRCDIKDQEKLYKILFDTGVKAYVHLQTFILATSTGQMPTPPPLPAGAPASLAPRLAALDHHMQMVDEFDSRMEHMDDALEAIRTMELLDGNGGFVMRDLVPQHMTNDMAANALEMFANSTVRRPPTRAVEGMMAAAQDSAGAHSADLDRDTDPASDESLRLSNEDTLLGLACAAGYTELAQMMMRVRGSPDFGSDVDCTPLMEAASAGCVEIVRSLLAYGADVNAESLTHNTPLVYAAAAGHVEVVKELLKTGKCALEQRNENGHCALMEAASAGHLDIVKELVKAGAQSVYMNSNSEFKVGLESPLTLASYKGHVELVEYLLSLGGGGQNRSEELHTALMEASMDGHVEVASKLLEYGAPVNLASDSFESPLTLASCGGHDQLVRMLLDAGASIEEPNDESYTPLMEAAREGHEEVVGLLVSHGAQVNAQTEETGETALTLAACGGFTNVVEVLLQHGGDLELGANTPLMEAAQEGHLGTVQFILQHMTKNGAEMSGTTRTHMNTAMTFAAENGHQDVVRAIVNHGGNVDFEADGGRTALMKAAKNGYMDVVSFLVFHGADVNKRSTLNDATALSLACAAGHVEMTSFLLKSNADPHVLLKDGVTCMLEAAKNGHVPIVQLLLDGGAVSVAGAKHRRPAATAPFNAEPLPLPYTQSLINPALMTAEEQQELLVAAMQAASPATFDEMRKAADALHASGAGGGMGRSELLHAMYKQAVADNLSDFAEQERIMIGNIPSNEAAAPPRAMANEVDYTPSNNYLVHVYENLKKKFPGLPAAKAYVDGAGDAPQLVPPPALTEAGVAPPCTTMLQQQHPVDSNSIKYAPLTVEDSDKYVEMFSQLPARMNNDMDALAKLLTVTDVWSYISEKASYTPSEREQVQRFIERGHDIHHGDPFTFLFQHVIIGLYREGQKCGMAEKEKATEEAIAAVAATVSKKKRGSGGGGPAPAPAPIPPVANVRHATVAPQPHPHPTPPARRTLSESSKDDVAAMTAAAEAVAATEAAAATAAIGRSSAIVSAAAACATVTSAAADSTTGNGCCVDMQTESNHDTPLTLACSNGHTAMVNLLLDRGADIKHRDKKGFTPLILAATGGHMGVVELLLAHGAELEAESERTKDTALSLACSGGRKEVVELLLNKGAKMEHRNVSDYTPLSLAASGGYVEIVNMLLNAGAEINSRTGSKLGISPLMLAAMNGHVQATRVLLERGSDINAQIETNRNTALTLACFQGRTEVVRLLLAYHANVEHRAKTGLTPLMEAANGGYTEVGELLLDACADPNTAPVPSSKDTALTIAADKGHEKFVEMLVHRGAAIDARNKKNCTALFLAAHGGHLETVMILVKHQADVDAQDNRKVSPLVTAFRKGHVKVVKYLVQHVKQFPGDDDLRRYCNTITETDLVAKCQECSEIIRVAKEQQAVEADKAADALMRLLEEEEQQAKSKKQAKQKKKEKKKADKQAKDTTKKTVAEEEEKKKDAESDTDSTSPLPPTPRKEEEERVVVVVQQEEEKPALPDPPVANQSQSAKQRRSNRRSRNESGKSATGAAVAAVTLPVSASPVVALSPSKQPAPCPAGLLSPAKPHEPHQEEWVKAAPAKKKTKAAATPSKPSLNGVPSLMSLVDKHKDYYLDDNGAYGGWKDVELSRRRAATLNVCSSVIARVIGRGGANINAIREATGASIEVEKQSATRRDQHDRQIAIRGTQETCKNAVLMINGLIADHEVSVTDVIKQVLRNEHQQPAATASGGGGNAAAGRTEHRETSAVRSTSGGTSRTTPVPFAPAATPTAAVSALAPTTNVWQQRIAARQKEQQKGSEQCVSPPPPPPSAVPVAAVVPAATIEQIAAAAAPMASPASLARSPPAVDDAFTEEERQRKAPGYRPVSSGTPSTLISNANDRVRTASASPSESSPVLSALSAKTSQHASPTRVLPVGAVTPIMESSHKEPMVSSSIFSTSSVSSLGPTNSSSGMSSAATTVATAAVHPIMREIPVAPMPSMSPLDSLASFTRQTSESSSCALPFMDENKKARLAEIWGCGAAAAGDSAWANRIFDGIGAMHISQPPTSEWMSGGVDLFGGMAPSPPKPVSAVQPSPITSQSLHHHMQQQQQHGVGGGGGGGHLGRYSAASDWQTEQQQQPQMKSNNMPLYARPHAQSRMPATSNAPLYTSNSQSHQPQQQQQQQQQQHDSTNIFNQLAAQLLTHGSSSSQQAAPPPPSSSSSYYPSPSYTDRDTALGSMSGHSNHSSQQQQQQHRQYAMPQQQQKYGGPSAYSAASTEFDSLNVLLSSFHAGHQSVQSQPQQQQQQHSQHDYMSQQQPQQQQYRPRATSAYASGMPPPGFAAIPPPRNDPLNTTVPPPSMRQSAYGGGYLSQLPAQQQQQQQHQYAYPSNGSAHWMQPTKPQTNGMSQQQQWGWN